jgi:hypothetical protein
MKSAVAANELEPITFGTIVESHWSPIASGQLCASSQMLGVMKE